MAMIGMSSPWVVFYREVDAMFKKDPEVHVVFDDDAVELKIFVDNAEKANAIEYLLPASKMFGIRELKIAVIPANEEIEYCCKRLKSDNPTINLVKAYRTALYGNTAYRDIHEVRALYNNTFTYVMFIRTVVQYFTDDLGDYNGVCSTLYENIARDIFDKTDGVYFCTDVKDTVTFAF